MDHMSRILTLCDVKMRTHRHHSILTADGIDGGFRVSAALRESGYRVRDVTADVRKGALSAQ